MKEKEQASFQFDKGFTHGGTFHADDVFSTAFLLKLNPNLKIERGFRVPENYDGIVYDIGLGKFDHHGDNETRENGVPYAAFGKLWREYGGLLFEPETVKQFDASFIQPLDKSDNTGEKDALAVAIFSYNLNWNEERTPEREREAFMNAVSLASSVLERQFDFLRAREQAKEEVLYAMKNRKDDRFLILNRYMPYKEMAMQDKSILFAIYPSNRGGYNIEAIPKSLEKKENRVPFPEKWLGKPPEELGKMQEGLTFCHKSNFLASAKTENQALDVAITAVKEYEKQKEKEQEEELDR